VAPNHSQQIVQKLWDYQHALRDESLDDGSDLADPDLIAAEIIEDLRAALDEFAAIQGDLAALDRGEALTPLPVAD